MPSLVDKVIGWLDGWDGPTEYSWMTVILKVNVAGQMLFGWLVDFCKIKDDTQSVKGLMDTTPSVMTVIIHRFFNVLPQNFHLIWFALGASCLGHTELSNTMGWAGQFCVSGNIFLSQFIRITSFKCIVKFISDVIEIQFVSSRHNGPGGDKGTLNSQFLSIHMEMLNNHFLQDLCLLAKMVDPSNLLAVHNVAVRRLEYLGAFCGHGQKGDW